jgi:integrase
MRQDGGDDGRVGQREAALGGAQRALRRGDSGAAGDAAARDHLRFGEAELGQRLLIEIADLPAADRRRVDSACTFKRRVFLDHNTAALLREHRKAQLKVRLKAGEAWADNNLVFCQDDGQPWRPDHVSKRFKKLAALAGVPVVTLHEGGRHTGNSLMQDAGVDQELRMREVGHADRSVNDRYTHPLEQAHLAASEQTAALVRKAGRAS